MRFTSIDGYTNEDKKINEQLNNLFFNWLNLIKQKYDNYDDKCFITDGIFPRYSEQKIKILYIGRETRFCYDMNYIDAFLPELWKNRVKNNNVTVDENNWFRRILKISYGIINGYIDFEFIPEASYISKDICTINNISFSIINLSKIDNANSYISNFVRINKFINDTLSYKYDNKYNYFLKQIEIINPDVIISMNIYNQLSKIFKDKLILKKIFNKFKYLTLICHDKTIPIIDSFHFSSYAGYEDKYDFYNPICSILMDI